MAKSDKRKPKPPDLRKCSITVHTDPATATTVENAMLLGSLMRTYELSESLPNPTYPLHVVLEFGEGSERRRVCGSVSPATIAENESFSIGRCVN